MKNKLKLLLMMPMLLSSCQTYAYTNKMNTYLRERFMPIYSLVEEKIDHSLEKTTDNIQLWHSDLYCHEEDDKNVRYCYTFRNFFDTDTNEIQPINYERVEL